MASFTLPPKKAIKHPSDIAGMTNGQLGAGVMVKLPGGGKAHHLAARAFEALAVNALAAVGLGLTYTQWYRTYNQQVTLFKSRYAPGGAGGGCKMWDSDGNGTTERWCKIDADLADAATPGKSDHGWALAGDVAYDRDLSDGIGPDDATYIAGHPGWQWLIDNAESFGFTWTNPSEPWHLTYFTGDTLPELVHAWERFRDGTTDPDTTPPSPTDPEEQPPTPEPPASGGTYMQWLDTIQRGANGRTVQVLQSLLATLGYSGTVLIDGVFGRETENAVRWYQGVHELTIDGIVGPKTWHSLGADGPRTQGGESDQG